MTKEEQKKLETREALSEWICKDNYERLATREQWQAARKALQISGLYTDAGAWSATVTLDKVCNMLRAIT